MTPTDHELEIPALYASLPALRKVHVRLVTAVRRAGSARAPEDTLRRFMAATAETGCVLHDEAQREVAQRALDYWVTTFVREGWEPGVETLAEFDLERAPELPESACPYVGLAAFDEPDAARFFGREAEVAELVRRRMEDGRRLLAVIGPSGSGKSSFVQAGVLPALRKAVERAAASDDVERARVQGAELRVHRMVPTQRPLQALATTMGSRQPDTDALAFADSSEQAVHLARVETGHTLLIVDQLEELFTLCSDVAQQRAFAGALLDMSEDPQANTTVLFTLRSDLEERLAALPELHAGAREGTLRLPPLSAVELRSAVERPANAVGLKFEAGVVEQLVEEVRGEFAALPLLQFTLRALWQRRTRNLIPMRAFVETGGARRALEKAAEAVFSGLIPEEQQCARRVFSRLVQSSASFEFTRRRALRSELRGLEDPSRVDRVVDRFVAARLMSARPITRDAVVEITHEALVRSWPRLVGWLEDNRHLLRQHAQLQTALAVWREGGEHAHDLLSPGRIAHFAELSDLDRDEKHFLKQSQAHWASQRQARTRRSQLAMGGLALAVLFAGLGWWQAYAAREVAGGHIEDLKVQQAVADKSAADAVAARKEAARERDLAREQERQAIKAKADADKLRSKATELAAELAAANRVVEGKLADSNQQQVANLEDVLALVERALPAVPVATPDGDAAGDRERFQDASKDLGEVDVVARRVRQRVQRFERLLQRKDRKAWDRRTATAADKERRARVQLVRDRVAKLNERLAWVSNQIASRRAQVATDAAQIKARRTRALARSHERRRGLEIRRDGIEAYSALRKVVRDQAPGWRAAVQAQTTAFVNKHARGNDRAHAKELMCGLWIAARDRPRAAKCFQDASRLASTKTLKDHERLRAAWTLYRHASSLKASAKQALLKRVAGSVRHLERFEASAVQLARRVHSERIRDANAQFTRRLNAL